MTKHPNPEPASEAPPLSLEKAEKGSHRSMWELLLQLRVLLPYLARLAPLLDRGILKPGPDVTELTKGIATMQTRVAIWKCKPGIRHCSWNALNNKWGDCAWFTKVALKRAANS